ncbi:LytR/AlgR family response regulator transcription factor [Aquabacterium sp.]|uniref:LytR/AlgR family response regulator transcription factor n=1 Tax=Aquabacterium sp. TaxID=1872578 RepID=UPI002C65E56C|nr:LytTR family DNA-binding domain-containing protein [Aquabacterium sp.]HSW06398.1 LytTR family DNA-binding domain-containing protein [Aquabacterium sp.]
MKPLTLFIAEDEPPALARLIECLQRVAPTARVVGTARSLQASRTWLSGHPAPDLLLLDIQLADGLSLALFDPAASGPPPASPVIFTTAHDAFVLEAFKCNAIDYLLKPVSESAMAAALARYESLSRHFTGNLAGLLAALTPQTQPQTPARHPWRQRLVLRRGSGFASLRCDEVAWCTSVDKLTFVLTRSGERLLADETLAELEAALDPQRFFRANRQFLVQLDAVKGFRPQGKGQLRLELQPAHDAPVLVSQERAKAFRDWLQQ